MKKIILLDGNSLLFRAFYATSYGDTASIMRTKSGIPTNAIFAFSNMVSKLLKDIDIGDGFFVAFDTDSHTFRKEEYAEYKAGRKPAPQELIDQFPISREYLDALSIPHYEESGIEADDICGTVATVAEKEGFHVDIYTSDKDYLQLVSQSVTVHLLKTGLSNMEDVTPESMVEKYGFAPLQIIDFKGLRGDSSDNLPGIPGVGDKTAVKLIQDYGSFDAIIEAAKAGTIKGKLAEKLIEGEEMGRICLRLAKMKLDCVLPFGLEGIAYPGYDFQRASEFAAKYELRSMLSRLPDALKAQNQETHAPEVKTVSSLNDIALKSPIGVCLDLDSSAYHEEPILGIALADSSKIVYLETEDFLKDEKAKTLLLDPNVKKVAFDAKCILVGLKRLGIEASPFADDFLLQSYLLDAGASSKAEAAFSLLGIDLGLKPQQGGLFEQTHADACGKIAYWSLMGQKKAIAALEEAQSLSLYREIELPLAHVLAKMEIRGFPLDKDKLREIGKAFVVKRDEAEQSVYAQAGHPFNLASPKQVAAFLYDELGLPGGKARSTAVEVLNELLPKAPIIADILRYRKYAKLVSTYVDGLIPHIKADGKIHTIFNQAQTATGRLSSSNPNLQNISARDEESKTIRQAFYYPDGTAILSLDYSQIELRILAALSSCQKYIDVFSSGRDVHSETARAIYALPSEQEVPHELRRKAKAVNFAIVYGTTMWGLADQIGCSNAEAKEIIFRFYSTYPEIQTYLNSIVDFVEKNGYVTTMMGRRRYIRDIRDPNFAKREAAKRQAMNAPVQGSAADLIKIAMIQVERFLEEGGYQTKMVLQIHDELIFAGPREELEALMPKLKSIMENAYPLPVKLNAEGSIGDSWYEAKD